jgi:hypothetical protein
VHSELTVDLMVPLPGFLIKNGANGLMETATDGLRKRVLKVKGGWSFHRQAGRSSSSGSAIVKTTSTMYGSSCS